MAWRFVPTDHAGLEYWFEAWKLTGLSDGDAITSATDQTPYKRHGTPAGSPTYETNELNGRAVARFNGSNQYITSDDVAAAFSGSDKPYSIYIVFKLLSSSNFKYPWSFGNSGDDDPHCALRVRTAVGFDSFRSDDVPATGAISPATNNYDEEWHIHSFVFSGTSCELFLDGASVNSGAQDLGTMTVDQFTIGALGRTSYSSHANMDLAAILVYSDNHTDEERGKVENYLNNRYQVYSGYRIPVSLADTSDGVHPFHLKYATVLPSNGSEIMQNVDVFLGAFPDDGKAEDASNQTHEQLRSWNPNLSILQYVGATYEPGVHAGITLPWGTNPYAFRVPYWREINREETAFFHAGEPAGLTAVVSDQQVILYWMPDSRTVIDDLNPATFDVYRATVSGGPYTKLTGSPQAARNYTDGSLTNGTTYYYKITSTDGSYEYDFSEERAATPTATPPTNQLYLPLVEIWFDANESNDGGGGFGHPLPGKSIDYTFSTYVTGSPAGVSLFLTGENYNDGFTEYAMADQGGGKWSKSLVKAISASFHGGFAWYVQTDGSVREPASGSGSYTTNINNRIRSNSWGFYRTNPSSQKVREFHSRWIAAWVDYGYDGFFYDLLGTQSWHGSDEIPALGYSDPATYYADKKAMVEYVKNNEPNAIVFGNLGNTNGTGQPVTPAPDGDYYGTIDGGLIEFFVIWNDGTYMLEDYWKNQINEAITWEANGGGMLYDSLSLTADGPNYDISDRMYCLASYLLAKGNKSYEGLLPIADIQYLAEYDIAIGAPTESYSDVDDYLDSGLNVYVRNFTNGRVYVNPSVTVTSEKIPIGRGFIQYEPVGGTVLSGTSGFTETPVSSIQLAPHTGVVLLRKPSGGSGTSRKKVLAISLEIKGYVTIESENGENM